MIAPKVSRLRLHPTPMIRFFFILFFSSLAFVVAAQNPATVIQIPNKDILLPCTSTCATITATVPHIKQTDNYFVKAIPYKPYPYAAGGTELVPLYADDIYSSVISLPFPVCFYGSNYTGLVVGSNGLVTFDLTNAGKRNNFRQTANPISPTPVPIPYAGGIQNSLASTYYPKAAIMGVYHDIFPFNNGTRRIEWRIEGSAPKRRFIVSYKDIPLYSCTSLSATHQLVVYESTGIVEVYIQDKPQCVAWNEGLATLGLQNFTRNKAVFPLGKNASRWGSTGMNEAYRFIPSAGLSKFVKAELLSGNTVTALADTLSGTNGDLNLSFANVCPAADSTSYLLRVTYQSCTAPGTVSFEDSVVVRKEKLDLNLQVENASCTKGGTLTATATGTSPSLLYRLDTLPPQAGNVFSNLAPGNYTVSVSSATCTRTATATVVLQNDLTVSMQASAIVCAGEQFVPQVSSNGDAFQWSPGDGISNTRISMPQIKAAATTAYTLLVTKGSCQQSATLELTVKPLPLVNAGADQTIIQGDATRLAGAASPGTYAWTPATALSNATILSPIATPTTTTTYQLQATTNGCTATDDVTINVVPYCVAPMEAFTPNGDGLNDLWLVTKGYCLKRAKVQVFNRYGAMVFQSEDYKNNWAGTYEGKPLADGTYYYLITYQLINGNTVSVRGTVTILR